MEVDIQTHPAAESRQELSPKLMDVADSQTNGAEKIKASDAPKRRGRSRSRTPKRQSKRKNAKEAAPEQVVVEAEEEKQHQNGDAEVSKEKIAIVEELLQENNESLNGNIEKELKEKAKELPKRQEEAVEMDPLVLNADEPDPELVFDETSDLESANSSPLPTSRCKTRRSQTRSIPTPKTPRSLEPEPEPATESKAITSPDGKSTPITSPILDHTYDSIDLNISTRAEAGSDTTRLEFEISNEDNSYLEAYKNRSIRGLSARRSIRPAEDYLKQALRNNRGKAELNSGLKRKHDSDESPDAKKYKSDSTSSLLTMFSSPIASIRSRFAADAASSTPKLTGYKDENGVNYADNQIQVEDGTDPKKSWCSLM